MPSRENEKKFYKASIFLSPCETLPNEFAESIIALEKSLDAEVWLIVHKGEGRFGSIDDELKKAIFDSKSTINPNKSIALLIDSPGGTAKSAYQIANIFRKHCNGFIAFIPRYAKSAATLLILGANKIIFGKYAELGPLDAQYHDPEREANASALDEVQALERLHAISMEAVDQTMFLLIGRTRKKVDTLLPLVMKFVSDEMRPLFEKIDTVHYTLMSRVLKVAEEYAIRLLQPKYPREQALIIARSLVEKYPEHGFVIDDKEIHELGLEIEKPNPEQENIIDIIMPFLDGMTIIGRIVEVKQNEK